jgi:hypothetical protein
LDLLGFTREEARLSYDAAIKQHRETSYDEDGQEPPLDLLTFDEFRAFVAAHAIETLDDTFSYDSSKSDEQIANDPTVKRIPRSPYSEDSGYSERSSFGDLVGIVHPYCLLHVLAENANNREAELVWQYGPLVVEEYADASEFIPCARRTQTFLIATEGSSDVHILKDALQLLRPDVQDFFRFIDVSESHPFSGTAGLAKFAEGLTKIDVQNQVVFVFDNDAEGYDACQKLETSTYLQTCGRLCCLKWRSFDPFQLEDLMGQLIPTSTKGRQQSNVIWTSTSFKDRRPMSYGRTTRKTSMFIKEHWKEKKLITEPS